MVRRSSLRAEARDIDDRGRNHSDRDGPASGAAAPLRPALWLATAGGLGYLPAAPGTWGSAGGVALFAALGALSTPLFCVTWLALLALGVWASDVAERVFARADDPRVVIDEVVGQLLALAPLLAARDLGWAGWWAMAVTAFVAFRVFDVWKPGPVGWAERRFAGGVGVMADDVVAGGLAALVVAVVLAGLFAGGSL